MPAYPSILSVNQLTLQVKLGITEEERKIPQDVIIDLRLYFPKAPLAANDDHGNYLCYYEISQAIHALCISKEYRLIEYLVHEIYRMLRDRVPLEAKLWIRLRKPLIGLSCVEGGSSYSYTDLNPQAWALPE